MDFSVALAISASILYLIASGFYNAAILSGARRPNAVSWGLWSGVTLVNFTSYHAAGADWWSALLPTLSSGFCIATFVVTMFKGRYAKLAIWDMAAGIVGLLAVVTWVITRSAASGNVLVQVAILVGFVPTWRSTWTEPTGEPRLPWVLWTLVYGLGLAVVLLRGGSSVTMLYPGLMVIAHAAVAILAGMKK